MAEPKATCGLCGEPMPDGEEVFQYHGYSGPCPKPQDRTTKTECVAEYVFRDMTNGEFWLDVRVNFQPYGSVGPFDTQTERQRAYDDLTGMMRALGAKDVPSSGTH